MLHACTTYRPPNPQIYFNTLMDSQILAVTELSRNKQWSCFVHICTRLAKNLHSLAVMTITEGPGSWPCKTHHSCTKNKIHWKAVEAKSQGPRILAALSPEPKM